MGRMQGRNKGAQFSGRRITAGGAKKQQCHKYFLQYSTFASEKHQVRTWGAKLASCPGRHVTPLRPRLDVARYGRSGLAKPWSLGPYHLYCMLQKLLSAKCIMTSKALWCLTHASAALWQHTGFLRNFENKIQTFSGIFPDLIFPNHLPSQYNQDISKITSISNKTIWKCMWNDQVWIIIFFLLYQQTKSFFSRLENNETFYHTFPRCVETLHTLSYGVERKYDQVAPSRRLSFD